MNPDLEAPSVETSDELGRISAHFLSELFSALERHEISPARLVGDLPIPVGENGGVTSAVHWDHASTLLGRLEHHVGGPDGLEICGEWAFGAPRSRALRALAAWAASPVSLYRAATTWILPWAIQGLQVTLESSGTNRLSLEVRLPDGLRPCPQLLHLATGVFRALPRLLDMPDAVVCARAEERSAHYDITLPSSRTGPARIRRIWRSILSPGFVLRHLEDRQLELHARHANLSRALETSLASERHLRALSDAAVDMLCEIDAAGRLVFVSASVRDLMGYSSEQVTGSHYRLWVPTALQEVATRRFEAFRSAPVGNAVVKQRVELHAAHGRRVIAEASVRSHQTAEGEWRAVAILRDLTRREASARGAEAAPLDRLRSGVTAFRARHAGHPLERSLSQLVSVLENLEPGDLPAHADQMLEATRRMTQIVEHALIRDQEGDDAAQWIETRKLVGRVRDAYASRPEAGELGLRIDMSRGPAEIWGREALLDACLAGLIDWASERATLPPVHPLATGLLLSIETVLDHGASDGIAKTEIVIAVALDLLPERRPERRPEGTPPHDAELAGQLPRAHDAELALSIVRDAARALGGELVDALPAHTGNARRIRLPQPTAPSQSGTRSMSAPRARSFSSIRS